MVCSTGAIWAWASASGGRVGEDAQRHHGVMHGDADFGNVAAAGQIDQHFLDLRFAGPEGIDLALQAHAAGQRPA